jgi:hypothetical protein
MKIAGSPFTQSTQATNEENVQIPTPYLNIERKLNESRAKIYVKWEAENTTFLDYNPEIWLFRYKPSNRRNFVNPDSTRSKYNKGQRWVHPTHQNGSKHAGENKYSGDVAADVIEIEVSGGLKLPITSPSNYLYKNTEFTLPSKGVWQEIDIEADKYFYARDSYGSGEIKILQDLYENVPYPYTSGIMGILNGNAKTNVVYDTRTYFSYFCFVVAIKKDNQYYFGGFSKTFKIMRRNDDELPARLKIKF